MPGILSTMIAQRRATTSRAMTEIAFPFTAETVSLSIDLNNFQSFDVPRDSEGKRFSVKQLYADIAETLRPFGIGESFFKKTNLLLLSILSCGGDMCTLDQVKAVMIWLCAVFAIDDVFDGVRSKDTATLIAIAEAMRPKYDESGLPAEIETLLTESGRTMVETMNNIRRDVMYPQLRTRRAQFDYAFDIYMEGVVHELQGKDATTNEAEYLVVRLADAGMLQFLELNWDFHGVSGEEIDALERASVLGQLIVGVDNDIISHEKTVKERGDDAVYDYVTVYGDSLNAAASGRDVLYAEYVERVDAAKGNRGVTGISDWVAANVLFGAASRRYMKAPLNIQRFFRPEVAAWMVDEGLIVA